MEVHNVIAVSDQPMASLSPAVDKFTIYPWERLFSHPLMSKCVSLGRELKSSDYNTIRKIDAHWGNGSVIRLMGKSLF